MAESSTTTALINALYERGARHLRAAEPLPPTERLDTATLIVGLATHPRPRLRESLILLFLRRPETNALVPHLLETLDPRVAETLAHMYTGQSTWKDFGAGRSAWEWAM